MLPAAAAGSPNLSGSNQPGVVVQKMDFDVDRKLSDTLEAMREAELCRHALQSEYLAQYHDVAAS